MLNRRGLLPFAVALGATLTVSVGAHAQTTTPTSGWGWTGPTGAPWETGTWDAPTAAFTAEPPFETGRDIPLHATATHTKGKDHIVSYEWDFDDDGQYDDATGEDTTVRYATPGDKVIGLKVTDDQGHWAETRPHYTIEQGDGDGAGGGGGGGAGGTGAPTAAFTVKGTRQVGKTLTFTSTSTGTIQSLAWDLDGDGQYDDATGATAKAKFSTAGPHTVGLRATGAGASDDAQQAITIAAKPKKKKGKSKKA